MAKTEFNQLWGTFSVRDHMKPGAFRAEALLYDRLVIPTPPKNQPAEWDRWKKHNWDPVRQSKILDCLAGLAEPVEWTGPWQTQWEQNWNDARRGVTEQVARELGYFWTGKGLLEVVPAHAKGIVAASSYATLSEVRSDLGIRRTKPKWKLPPGLISVAIGRKLLVPQHPKFDELDLLREAADVARDPEFQKKRAAYNQWVQKFLDEEGMTDAVSVREAVRQMDALLDAQQSLVRNKKLWKAAKVAFFFTQVVVGVVFAPLRLITAGNAALSVGGFTVSEKLSALNKEGQIPAAAVLLEARRKLNLGSSKLHR
ncbi:MAG TPA: hypothetical protein VGS58_17150 [Candidatus Sulfopaludibacter sp.]|nr:hypothetical protein [Candidatus Sulfopaludibacter sp.]